MEKVFVEGMYYNKPTEKAPHYIVANLSFSKDKFIAWLEQQEANEKGYVKVVVKTSKNDKVYSEVDNWKPEEKKEDSLDLPTDELTEAPF